MNEEIKKQAEALIKFASLIDSLAYGYLVKGVPPENTDIYIEEIVKIIKEFPGPAICSMSLANFVRDSSITEEDGFAKSIADTHIHYLTTVIGEKYKDYEHQQALLNQATNIIKGDFGNDKTKE